MIPGAPAYRALAELSRGGPLRLDPGAVRRLLMTSTRTEETIVKPDDPTTAPSDFERRAAVQEQHAREAVRNATKSRQPGEILTDDERKVIERSKGAA